jgi:hypothetical protein
VAGPPPALALRVEAPAGGAAGEAIKGERQVYFPEAGGYTLTPVYDRYRLAPGATFSGPAVVEEEESTAVVVPRASCSIDGQWNLVIALPPPPAPPVRGPRSEVRRQGFGGAPPSDFGLPAQRAKDFGLD